MDLFDKLGGQKYQVFKYIIENRSRDNNTLITTNKELSRLTKTSTKTVQDTINLLKEAGLIERRMGAIMLNPKLVHRGSKSKRKVPTPTVRSFRPSRFNREIGTTFKKSLTCGHYIMSERFLT
ncbi:replication/maintenance protein RepL [Levilactobacillus brevis]